VLTNGFLRRCGAQEESSAHILCDCEALASLRLTNLGSFCYTQKTLRVEFWGSSVTPLKEEGSLDLPSDYGAQRAVYRPRCKV